MELLSLIVLVRVGVVNINKVPYDVNEVSPLILSVFLCFGLILITYQYR